MMASDQRRAADIPPERMATTRDLLRRAILTLASVPDPDIRYRLGPRSSWPAFVRQARDAYGAAPPKLRRFSPTPADHSRYLDVLAWLRWYEAEYPESGFEAVRLFLAWTFGYPMWQLQMRCTTNRRQPATPKTVHRRLDEMVRTIAKRFSLDECPYLDDIPANLEENGNSVGTELTRLPNSPKAWKSAVSEPPMTPKQERRAHADLTKHLERNRMKAMRREAQR